MDMDQILADWVGMGGVYQQAATWDEAAARWEEFPIPSWQDDPFLQMLDDEVDFRSDMRVLDIGCGSGIYGFALAPRVSEVIGVDISPKMVEAARRRARAEGIENASFLTGDFLDVDVQGPFDLVLAHMTPAIRDGRTFKRMLDLSGEYCYMAKPCRRTDPVLQEAQRLMGVETHDAEGRDESILRAIMAVWQGGMTPSMRHYHERWDNARPLDEALAFYRDRQAPGDLDAQAFDEVTRYLESLAVDGMVREAIDTEVVMMGWRMR